MSSRPTSRWPWSWGRPPSGRLTAATRAGTRQDARRQRPARRHPLGRRRRRRPAVRRGGVPRRADHPPGGQRGRAGGGHRGAGRGVPDRGAGPGVGGHLGARSDIRGARRATRPCWSTTPATSRAATCRPDKELLEHIPTELFDTAQHIASRGPFLVAKEVLPAMRRSGHGLVPHLQQRGRRCAAASARPASRSTTRG